jgi:hypothetical protein
VVYVYEPAAEPDRVPHRHVVVPRLPVTHDWSVAYDPGDDVHGKATLNAAARILDDASVVARVRGRRVGHEEHPAPAAGHSPICFTDYIAGKVVGGRQLVQFCVRIAMRFRLRFPAIKFKKKKS